MNDKTPMDLLKKIAPEFAEHQMIEKKLLFENNKYQSVPKKYKFMIGIAVASALGSDMCTQMWTKQAIDAGADNSEIIEAMMVSRFMKQATVNDTIANSVNKFLLAEKDE